MTKPPQVVVVSHFLGLDIGKRSDPSMLCLLERRDIPGEDAPQHEVRQLVRWHLGTSYTQVKSDVMKLADAPSLVSPLLVVDQTGVGEAVVDDFREAGAPLLAVTIRGGESAPTRSPDGSWMVSKKDLVGTPVMLLANRRLAIPKGIPGGEHLERELRDLQIKITKAANEKFEARAGQHDDLAIACALACWASERCCGAMPAGDIPEAALTMMARVPEGVFQSDAPATKY